MSYDDFIKELQLETRASKKEGFTIYELYHNGKVIGRTTTDNEPSTEELVSNNLETIDYYYFNTLCNKR